MMAFRKDFFEIPRGVFDAMYHSDKNHFVGDWTNVLYKQFYALVPTCPLQFFYNHCRTQGSRKKNCNFWIGKAKCKIGTSKVLFYIKDLPEDCQPVTINFEIDCSCAHFCSTDGAIIEGKRFLKGSEKENVVHEMINKNMTPNVLHLEKMANTTVVELLAGNLTKPQNPSVLKQALYVARKNENLCDSVHGELIIMNEVFDCTLNDGGVKGYIQHLSHNPFSFTLFMKDQVQVYCESCKKSKLCLINFDCTGSIIKRFERQKPAFLYSLVLNGCNISVCDFVTTNNKSFAIEAELSRFLASARTISKTAHFPDIIVTDFSYALINACMLAFNKMTITRYLDVVFKVMTSRVEKLDQSSINTIHGLCYCHIMKAVANRLVYFFVFYETSHFTL